MKLTKISEELLKKLGFCKAYYKLLPRKKKKKVKKEVKKIILLKRLDDL